MAFLGRLATSHHISGYQIYTTVFFLSQINYCCFICRNAPDTTIMKSNLLQWALKTILHIPRRTSTEWVYAKTKALTVSELFYLQSLVFMYKYNRDLLPPSFQNLSTMCSTISLRETRSNDDYYISKCLD